MSSPYLHDLKKPELTDLAKTTSLPGYSSMKVGELRTALDDHLQRNSTRYANEPSLSAYYGGGPSSSRSPVKQMAEKVKDLVKSDDDAQAVVKKPRRKTQDVTKAASDSTAVTRTPSFKDSVRRMSSSLGSTNIGAPSPRVVTDTIERTSRQISGSVRRAYESTHLTEYSDRLRDNLSTPSAVAFLAAVLEGYSLFSDIMPFKKMTDIRPIPYVKDTRTSVLLPNLFVVLEQGFWAPFTLWLLTSLILPATVAYFINLPLKAHPGPQHGTRRASTQASTPSMQFDPFVFSIVKGLLAYIVYAQHFQFFGLYSNFAIATVNESIYGGYSGMLSSTGICAALALYDAVLNH